MSNGFTQEHLDRLKRGERRAGTERYTAEQARTLFAGGSLPQPEPARPSSKMGNEPTVYNGFRYDSKAEAGFARKLDLRKRIGEVVDWKPHKVYELRVNDVLICTYELDFWVLLPGGVEEHYDVKGQRSGTPYALFKCKRQLMLACHGITVLEVAG